MTEPVSSRARWRDHIVHCYQVAQQFPGHLLAQVVTLTGPFIVYLRTMCPTVYSLDSAELVTGAYALGIVHAPGYPLYLLLAKLFTYLPWGDVAWRVNLMSAVWAALALWLLYRVLYHYTQDVLVSCAASLFFAFTYYFWTAALVAEVYSLQALFTVSLILLLLKWEQKKDSRLLYLFAWIYGSSLGNHLSSLLQAFGFAYFVWSAGCRTLRWKNLAFMAICFLLGLSVYLYLPLRYLANPSFNYAGHFDADGVFHSLDLTDARNLVWFVSGRAFASSMFAYSLGELGNEIVRAAKELWGNFLGVGLVPGIWGALWLFRHRRRHFFSLALLGLAHWAFFVNYRVVDKSTMFLPTYVIWAIWMGIGYRAILSWLSPGQVAGFALGEMVLSIILFLTVLLPLTLNYGYADISDDHRARELTERIFDEIEPEAIFMGHWGTAAPLSYLQVVEGRRPDVLIVNLFLIRPEVVRQLVEKQIGKRPLYFEHLYSELESAYRFIELPWGYQLRRR